MESRVEGGLTGVFRNQRKISFYFIQFLHSEVAWEAQSSILSVKLDMNRRGTPSQKKCYAGSQVSHSPPKKGGIDAPFLNCTSEVTQRFLYIKCNTLA